MGLLDIHDLLALVALELHGGISCQPLLREAAGRALQVELHLPHVLGQEELVDRANHEGGPDLLLAVYGEAPVGLPDLLQQLLHQVLLPHEVDAPERLPGPLDELMESVLVRVARVESVDDLLLEFVVEVLALDEEILGRAWSSHEHALELLVRQERFVDDIGDLLVELVGRYLDQPLEPARGLTSPAVLARHEGWYVLDGHDPLAVEDADGGLAPVYHDEAVGVLVLQHLVERFREEPGIASV